MQDNTNIECCTSAALLRFRIRWDYINCVTGWVTVVQRMETLDITLSEKHLDILFACSVDGDFLLKRRPDSHSSS